MDRDSGDESGYGAQAGRDTETNCLSRLAPGVQIHLHCPDLPRLTVFLKLNPIPSLLGEGLLHHCLQLLFERLAKVSLLLPAPIAVFCVAAQQEIVRLSKNYRENVSSSSSSSCSSKPVSPARDSVGVQLLVGAVFKHLCDATFVESVTGSAELKSSTRDTLRLLADCFFHAATEDEADAISTTTASAEAVAKKRNIPKQVSVRL